MSARPGPSGLFYDELSDPDLIRVGDWFYLTGSTMHAVPGVQTMRSKDWSTGSSPLMPSTSSTSARPFAWRGRGTALRAHPRFHHPAVPNRGFP